MNITDYLVEYLKSGKAVEIPQAGVLATKEIEAHLEGVRYILPLSANNRDDAELD